MFSLFYIAIVMRIIFFSILSRKGVIGVIGMFERAEHPMSRYVLTSSRIKVPQDSYAVQIFNFSEISEMSPIH